MTQSEAIVAAAEFANYELNASEVANATVTEREDGIFVIEFTSEDIVAVSVSGECMMVGRN